MKYIELTQGKRAIVDDEDYDMLSGMKWHVRGEYAVHSEYHYPKNPGTTSMHKLIMPTPEGKVIDHINGNGLDNRRSNLRIVAQAQNCMNKKPYSSSGYKGVTFDARYNSWQARIGINGKRITLGSCKTAIEAAKLYARAAKEIQGDYMHISTRSLV